MFDECSGRGRRCWDQNALPVSALSKNVPEAYKELEHTYKKLEKHYRDMLDLEFTIQEGKLYMLQTRVGKRTGLQPSKSPSIW